MSSTQASIKSASFISNFKEITKIRLSISVVFSSLAGYALGANVIDIKTLVLLAIGGYCMVGASNAYNQIIEKDLDALMHRTQNRPIPSGRMSVNSAFIIAVILTLAGVAIFIPLTLKQLCLGLYFFIHQYLHTLKNKNTYFCFCRSYSRNHSIYVRLGCCNE